MKKLKENNKEKANANFEDLNEEELLEKIKEYS